MIKWIKKKLNKFHEKRALYHFKHLCIRDKTGICLKEKCPYFLSRNPFSTRAALPEELFESCPLVDFSNVIFNHSYKEFKENEYKETGNTFFYVQFKENGGKRFFIMFTRKSNKCSSGMKGWCKSINNAVRECFKKEVDKTLLISPTKIISDFTSQYEKSEKTCYFVNLWKD